MYFFIFLLIGFAACSTGPKAIDFGSDGCSFCKMTISDKRFGAEVVTQKGKVYKYDDISCMLKAIKQGKPNQSDVAAYYVVDSKGAGVLINAQTASYLKSDAIKSPMGSNTCAFVNEKEADDEKAQFDGTVLKWDDLVNEE